MTDRTPDSDRLTVGTLNVWGRWADWPGRLAALRAAWPAPGPDVLMLQEVVCDGAGDQAAEVAEALGYPHAVSVEGHRTGEDAREGVALLSRRALRDARSAALPDSDPVRRLALAEVEVGDRTVTLVCGHTVAVPEAVRREQVHALLARPEDPLVLGADLNEPPASVAPVLAAVGLRDALGEDPVATWPTCEATFGAAWSSQIGRAPHFSLEPRRLDYLLTRGMRTLAAAVHDLRTPDGVYASDHALVVAEVAPAAAGKENGPAAAVRDGGRGAAPAGGPPVHEPG
jgi:endonuclease/exonuclease/phosphatase family metal-dependent hydrolase